MAATNQKFAFSHALDALAAGRTVAFSTDTVWGIGCDPRQPEAIERLYAQKGREAAKALQVLCADRAVAETWVSPSALTSPEWAALSALWPGALTLVVEAAPTTPAWLVRDGKVGLRVPGSAEVRAWLTAAGGALASSSLNRSGEPPAASYEEAVELGLADVVLPGARTFGTASTVFDVTARRVLREGGLPAHVLREALC